MYLRKSGDDSSVIEIDEKIIKISVNGYHDWLTKTQIKDIRVKSVREKPAIAVSVFAAGLGSMILLTKHYIIANHIMGLAILLMGAFHFYRGMERHQRLEISLYNRMTLKITMFHRKIEDIQALLVKHGYLS